jgi:hypothetical protein
MVYLRINRTAAEMVRDLNALEKWLGDLGLDKYDRVHQAIETVREHKTKFLANPGQDISYGGPGWEARTYMNAERDVIEFLDIFDAFRSEPYELIAPKLERASSGPFMPLDERAENADARNIQFELSLAAEWRLSGLNVRIGEPDFTLLAGTTDFIVECKRPMGEDSIRSNIKRAKRQLATQLDKSERAFGAIAISVGRIVVPPTHCLMHASDLPSVQSDPKRHLDVLLDELRRERGKSHNLILTDWAMGVRVEMSALAKRVRFLNFDFHERVVGMYFHAAPPYELSGHSGRLSLSMISPVGKVGPAFTYLKTATDAACNQA